MAGWHRGGFHRGHHRHGRPLFGFVMRHRQELALTPQQVESFQKLATDYRRDAIKREADMKLARVDLGALLRPDPASPGKAVDIAQAEAKIREIERTRGDMMVSRLRAVEQGRYLARSANTGVSGIVDPYGRVLVRSAIFEQTTLLGEIRFLDGRTIYAQIGDVLAYGCAVLTLGALLLARRR